MYQSRSALEIRDTILYENVWIVSFIFGSQHKKVVSQQVYLV